VWGKKKSPGHGLGFLRVLEFGLATTAYPGLVYTQLVSVFHVLGLIEPYGTFRYKGSFVVSLDVTWPVFQPGFATAAWTGDFCHDTS
jgi:hypothetical protein